MAGELGASFEEFARIIAVLRGPDGCPWDREQDHLSLRTNMIEEAYEAVSAMEKGEARALCDELGDVLLQIVLHAQIAADEGSFTIEEVIRAISDKIVRRHPHIFGDAESGTPDEVLHRWDRLKLSEGQNAGVFDGIPYSLPALMYAKKLSRRAVAVGFEWDTLEGVWDKVHEEIDELRSAQPGSAEATDEIGDLLFTLVNLARKQGIDAETALRQTCEKFRRRFEHVERTALEGGGSLEEMSLEQMEALWQEAKSREREDSRVE